MYVCFPLYFLLKYCICYTQSYTFFQKWRYNLYRAKCTTMCVYVYVFIHTCVYHPDEDEEHSSTQKVTFSSP